MKSWLADYLTNRVGDIKELVADGNKGDYSSGSMVKVTYM